MPGRAAAEGCDDGDNGSADGEGASAHPAILPRPPRAAEAVDASRSASPAAQSLGIGCLPRLQAVAYAPTPTSSADERPFAASLARPMSSASSESAWFSLEFNAEPVRMVIEQPRPTAQVRQPQMTLWTVFVLPGLAAVVGN
jgi:hypothetical protein